MYWLKLDDTLDPAHLFGLGGKRVKRAFAEEELFFSIGCFLSLVLEILDPLLKRSCWDSRSKSDCYHHRGVVGYR